MSVVVGKAPLVSRRTSTFPTKKALFWDATQWRGGYIRYSGAPGAVRWDFYQLDLRSGEVINLENKHER